MTRIADSYSFGITLRRHVERIDHNARAMGWQIDIQRNSGCSPEMVTQAESRYRRYVAASARLWTYAAKRAGIPQCCYVRHGDCGRHKNKPE